ncbi:Transmembrane protein 194A [Habropoda laboriosa]|uniref:Transmembrane protein 194A n=1 Tax=Habropoda laboriosa TaxID=597456 RepID=A0A0L7RHE8_9HYME|nr:Transmembrane protein 194A [Habropoda laboriosa]
MDNHISAIIFLVLSTLCTGFTATTHSIHFLKPSVVFQNNEPGLKIFCHNANTKDLIYIWKSLTIHLSTNTENYDLYNGKTPQEVMEKYENQRYWRFNLFGRNKSNKFQINPFEDVCIGVYVYPSDLHKYSMGITETRALFAMYHSSYFREVSIFSCIVIILLYNFPIVAIRKVRSYWKKMYPQRRKLLTENQYHTEGIRETNEALSELKEYCASPKCNPWKTVLILKDPIRFARFVEGESHLSDDETREHDAEITKIIEECEYTDDEDEYLINSTF